MPFGLWKGESTAKLEVDRVAIFIIRICLKLGQNTARIGLSLSYCMQHDMNQ